MTNWIFSPQPVAQATGLLEWLKAVAPYLAAGIAVWAAWYGLRRAFFDKRYEYAGIVLNHRIRQILDFYAPMKVHLEQSLAVTRKLRDKLEREDKAVFEGKEYPYIDFNGHKYPYIATEFRLLDWGSVLHLIPRYKGYIDDILAIGEDMTNLIAEKGGLIEGGITKVYLLYQGHYKILKRVIYDNEPEYHGPGSEKYLYYPRLLNREVNEGYKAVLRRLNDYIVAGDENIYKILGKESPEISSIEELQSLINNLEYYEYNADKYAERFDRIDLSYIYDKFMRALEGARGTDRTKLKILDVASGPGRDTQYFISEGFIVRAFDASPAMASRCRDRIRIKREDGNSAVKLAAEQSDCEEKSFEEIEFQSEFDGIWAMAAFVHVPYNKMAEVIERMGIALKRNGILYLSLKNGKGSDKFLNRTFYFYDKERILDLVNNVPNLRISDDNIWLTEEKDNRVIELTPKPKDWKDKKYWINLLIEKT